MTEDLKPCPFCACRAVIFFNGAEGYWGAECRGCRVSLSGYQEHDIAVQRWNERPIEENLEHELKIAQTQP